MVEFHRSLISHIQWHILASHKSLNSPYLFLFQLRKAHSRDYFHHSLFYSSSISHSSQSRINSSAKIISSHSEFINATPPPRGGTQNQALYVSGPDPFPALAIRYGSSGKVTRFFCDKDPLHAIRNFSSSFVDGISGTALKKDNVKKHRHSE